VPRMRICFYAHNGHVAPRSCSAQRRHAPAERGETLEALLIRAVQNELGRRAGVHVEWPLIRSRHKTRRRLTNAELERILIDDDVARLRLKAR